jgi:hypothetical protein
VTVTEALVVVIPTVTAVVWLLSQVYGLRSDLREIQTILRADRRANDERMQRIEATVESLAASVQELTLDLARHGLRDLQERRR